MQEQPDNHVTLIRAVARDLLARELPVVTWRHVEGKRKTRPVHAGDVDRLDGAGCALGLVTERSTGLVAVTLSGAAELAAAHIMPATGLVFGPERSPTRYSIYRADELWPWREQVPRFYSGENLLLYLQTAGSVPVPPSADGGDLTGDRLVWHRFTEPARVKATVLDEAVRSLAGATELGVRLSGAMHLQDAVLRGIVCALWREGWPTIRQEQFLRGVLAVARVEDTEPYVALVQSGECHNHAEPEGGWKDVAALGHPVVEKVRDWISPGWRDALLREESAPQDEWPEPPNRDAFYGLAGEVVDLIAPTTEADPVAILGQLLAFFGNIIGRGAYFSHGPTRHYANNYFVLVGQSSRARKGTSLDHVRQVYGDIDGNWIQRRLLSGLKSGPNVVWAVRDPVERMERFTRRGMEPFYDSIVCDHGEPDKRLLINESEFAAVLLQTKTPGNTLSPVLRQAWDGGNLRSQSGNRIYQATGAHVSLIGHITGEELRKHLSTTEATSGFANRIIWLATKRSKILPREVPLDPTALTSLRRRLSQAVDFARAVGEVRRDPDAEKYWDEIYPHLSADRPGRVGSLTSRAEAHTMRLALIFALLDRQRTIGPAHLKAAYALWRFAERSVVHIFVQTVHSPLAERLYQRMKEGGPLGVNRTDLWSVASRNITLSEMEDGLQHLLTCRRARCDRFPGRGRGRPSERWIALSDD